MVQYVHTVVNCQHIAFDALNPNKNPCPLVVLGLSLKGCPAGIFWASQSLLARTLSNLMLGYFHPRASASKAG